MHRRSSRTTMKYRHVILALDDEALYTAGSIARLAIETGLVADDDAGPKLAALRLRTALGRFSNKRKFPDEGDGTLTLAGQPPMPAWFGRRWKKGLTQGGTL